MIPKPWQSKMGKDAARLAASCDLSIWFLKVLHENSGKDKNVNILCSCA